MINKTDYEMLKSFLRIKNRIIMDEKLDVSANDYLLFLTVMEKGFVNDLGEKAITITSLAAHLNKSKAALSKHTKKLVKKGLIKKEKTGIDKRNRFIILSKSAQQLIYQDKTLGIISYLTEELGEKDSQELIRILGKIDQLLNHNESLE